MTGLFLIYKSLSPLRQYRVYRVCRVSVKVTFNTGFDFASAAKQSHKKEKK